MVTFSDQSAQDVSIGPRKVNFLQSPVSKRASMSQPAPGKLQVLFCCCFCLLFFRGGGGICWGKTRCFHVVVFLVGIFVRGICWGKNALFPKVLFSQGSPPPLICFLWNSVVLSLKVPSPTRLSPQFPPPPPPPGFRLSSICLRILFVYFPLLALKGIYHCWTCFSFFPGAKKQMVCPLF